MPFPPSDGLCSACRDAERQPTGPTLEERLAAAGAPRKYAALTRASWERKYGPWEEHPLLRRLVGWPHAHHPDSWLLFIFSRDYGDRKTGLGTAVLAAALRPAVERLAAAQEAVDLDRRQQQAVVAEKNRAIATFDVHFRAAVRWGVGLCRFADRPDLASKLNTARLQAPGRGASDDEAPPPDPTQEGPSAPDEPAAGTDSGAGEPTS